MTLHSTQTPKDNAHQRAISTWQSWPISLLEPPQLKHEILGGKTNRTYLLSTNLPDQPKLILRLFSKRSLAYGICRTTEQIIHSSVAEIGLAPSIIHWNNDVGFCVLEMFDGVPWSENDFNTPKKREALTEAIVSYQQLTIVGLNEFNYLAHLDHYAKLTFEVLNRAEQNDWLSFRAQLCQWQKGSWPRKITHHDLIAENILECKDGLKIIDWEYAGLGHPTFDWLDLPETAEFQPSDYQFVRRVRHWLERFWGLI